MTLEVLKAAQAERQEWVSRLVEGDTLVSLADTGKAVGTIYGLDCLLEGIEQLLRLQWAQAEERKEKANEKYVGR